MNTRVWALIELVILLSVFFLFWGATTDTFRIANASLVKAYLDRETELISICKIDYNAYMSERRLAYVEQVHRYLDDNTVIKSNGRYTYPLDGLDEPILGDNNVIMD